MSTLDTQLGTVDETAYGTTPVVSRFHEFNSESIDDASPGRTESTGLRRGNRVQRSDRFTPYPNGAAGDINLDVMTKGFGFWLKHMFGAVATVAPVDSVATHTGSIADLSYASGGVGKSFGVQVNRPLHPSGADQPFLFKGGKITSWELACSPTGNLTAKLSCDFVDSDTSIALATAAYPTAMENLTWVGGVILIGGVAVDVTDFSCAMDNQLKVDRRYQRGNPLKKEPVENGLRQPTWSLKADFESLAQRTRVVALTKAGALATLLATWTGPTLAGVTTFPALQISIPAARFDKWAGQVGGPDPLGQEVSGVGMFDGTNSAVSAIYKTVDTTP